MHKYNWIEKSKIEDVQEIHKNFWNTLIPRAYPLSKGKIRIPISLEPFIIEKKEYNIFKKDFIHIITACKKVVNHYFENKYLQNIILLDDLTKKLVWAHKDDDLVGIIRTDTFYNEKPQIIEINADFPDGFLLLDVTANTINESLQRIDFQFPLHKDILNEFITKFNIGKDDHIMITYNKERKFLDAYHVYKEILSGYGWKNVHVGTLEEIEYKKSSLYYKDNKLSLLRRCAETPYFTKNIKLAENLIKTNKQNPIPIINSFKMRIFGHKSVLAVLHDPNFKHLFSQDELNAIYNLVPKTYILTDELKKAIINKKDLYVLKPSDLAEGEGVCIGSSCTQLKWEEALEDAINENKPWIIQEKVDIPKTKFSFINDTTGELETDEYYYDINPFFILDKDKITLGHLPIRFAKKEILNVMQGGGLTYAFQTAD